MRVLITGQTGLLGSDLKKTLVQRGHEVVPFTHDLRDESLIAAYPGPYDWVIHTAALTNVDRCEREQDLCWDINAVGSRRVRDMARKAHARYVYISTASVFAGTEGNYAESDISYPKNFYNFSKMAGELYAGEYEQATIIRLVVIGIHQSGSRGRNFIEWLVDSFSENKDIQLFDDVTINPLSSITLSEQIETILKAKHHESVAHLTSGDRLSKAEIGRLVLRHFPNYTGTVTTKSSSRLGNTPHPKEMWLNSDRTARHFDISRPTIKDEVNRIFVERYARLHA